MGLSTGRTGGTTLCVRSTRDASEVRCLPSRRSGEPCVGAFDDPPAPGLDRGGHPAPGGAPAQAVALQLRPAGRVGGRIPRRGGRWRLRAGAPRSFSVSRVAGSKTWSQLFAGAETAASGTPAPSVSWERFRPCLPRSGLDAEERGELAHRQGGSVVAGDEQHPVGQRQRPLPARAPACDPVSAAVRHDRYQLVELCRAQAGEQRDGSGREAVSSFTSRQATRQTL